MNGTSSKISLIWQIISYSSLCLIISFSDVESILSTAKNNFDIVECVARNDFMLPDSLKSHLDILEKLKASGYIDFQNRFGTIIWYTEIYKAYNKTY